MGWVSALISRRTFKIWALAALLVTAMAAVAGGIAFGTTASCDNPATLTGSAFEIDTNANLVVDTTGCIDWQDGSSFRSGVDWKLDSTSGATDESFGEGTKEDTANPTIVNGSIPPNKSDLKAFGIYEETTQSTTDGFLNLFWARVQDPSGTTNMDFELNKLFCGTGAPASNCSTNGVTPKRSVNDILITYDLSRGGTQATISIRKWDGTKWGPAVLLANQSEALGTINTSTISTSPIITPQTPTGTLSPRTFGEASVTFDALFGEGQCGSLGSAYLKSRSSDSFTAALKDFVPPQQVNVSNCPATLTTDATDSVTVGNPISDTATLDVQAATNGSITFRLYGPFATAAEITSSSCTAGKLISGATSTKQVTNFNPSNPTYTSDPFTPTVAGFYNWTAQFTSTTAGVDSTGEIGCGDAAEKSQVNKASPSISTTLSDEEIAVGDSIHDSATLTGATADAGGTVTYTVYTNDTCTAGARDAGTKTVTNGSVPDSNTLQFNTAGDFYWQAVYSGDANNQGATSVCTSEHLVVGKAPSAITTAQELFPQDSATVSANAGGQPSGTVTFKLYSTADCSGTPVYEESVTLANGTANTDNTTFSVDADNDGAYKWVVEYGGDATHNGVTSACGTENFTATVNNG